MADDHRTSPGYLRLVDQGQKLSFLLRQRGDQRKQKSLGSSETVDGKPFVTSQKRLAEALGLHASAVTKMLKDELSIAHGSIVGLCEIFKVDAEHLTEWEFSRFRMTYSKYRSGWSKLLDSLETHTGSVHTEPPHARIKNITFRPLKFRPAGSVPAIRLHNPFWCAFDAPSARGNEISWEDWNVVLFNLDLRTDRVYSLPTDLRNMDNKVQATFPADGRFVFPAEGVEMTSSPEDIGEHAILCLVLAPNVNPELLQAARRETTPFGKHDLADLIPLAIAKREAALSIARYRVVE